MFEGRKCPTCKRYGVKKSGTDYWKIWSCVYCGGVWDRDRPLQVLFEKAEPMP